MKIRESNSLMQDIDSFLAQIYKHYNFDAIKNGIVIVKAKFSKIKILPLKVIWRKPLNESFQKTNVIYPIYSSLSELEKLSIDDKKKLGFISDKLIALKEKEPIPYSDILKELHKLNFTEKREALVIETFVKIKTLFNNNRYKLLNEILDIDFI